MTGITADATNHIQVGDLDIAYLAAGAGVPVVLLHGGLTTSNMSWTDSLQRLAGHFRVLAPDSRGHGGTNNPADFLAYDQMADDVAGFIEAQRLDRPFIVGYSDGAQIALEFGLRHPGKARGLVLGGVVTEPTPAYLAGLEKWGFVAPGKVDYDRLAIEFGDFFGAIKQMHGHGDPDYWQRFLPQIATLWINVPAYTEAQLRSIAEPALVVMGDRDEMAGLDQATRLYRNLPHGELAVVPDASHEAGTRPVFWDLVEDFLFRHHG